MTDEESVYQSTGTRSRKAIAVYLRRVADALEGGDPVPVGEDGAMEVNPPAESEFEVDLEREGEEMSLEVEITWPEAEGGLDEDPSGSDGTFELYRDAADEWRWRLRHDNGNIIADGGEGYDRRATAENGIDSVRRNAPGASVEELE